MKRRGATRRHLGFASLPMLLLTLVASGCERGLDRTPAEIQGRWITEDATYADTSFEIGPNSLTMDLGPEAGVATHTLDRIEEEVVGELRHYVLHHLNREGVEDALRIVYSEDPAPLIRLENRRNVLWRKADS